MWRSMWPTISASLPSTMQAVVPGACPGAADESPVDGTDAQDGWFNLISPVAVGGPNGSLSLSIRATGPKPITPMQAVRIAGAVRRNAGLRPRGAPRLAARLDTGLVRRVEPGGDAIAGADVGRMAACGPGRLRERQGIRRGCAGTPVPAEPAMRPPIDGRQSRPGLAVGGEPENPYGDRVHGQQPEVHCPEPGPARADRVRRRGL